MSRADLSEIRAFRSLGDFFGTAGQPTEAQFPIIRDAGFAAVVNLALPTSDNAIPYEGSISSGLGMTYVHIPVRFDEPKDQDFATFRRVLDAFRGQRVFVHCAANMRVSAFMYLYRILELGDSAAEAERDLHAVWEPDEVWSAFISRQLSGKA